MEKITKLIEKLKIDSCLFKACKVQLLTIEELKSFAECDCRFEIKINIEYDLAYDRLYQGSWNEVPEENRRLFQVLTFLKAFCVIKRGDSQKLDNLLKALKFIDVGIVVGTGLKESHLLTEFAQLLHEYIGKMHVSINYSEFPNPALLPVDKYPPEKLELSTATYSPQDGCDIDSVSQPSEEHFWTKYLNFHRPVKLKNCINHWPAMTKWGDLNYLSKTAGYRTVPIELGKKYDSNDWSQGMFRLGEFLRQFMSSNSNCSESGYLAQHDLFEQIPQLKQDFTVPDYCAIGTTDPVVKIWVGPQNTISTMHTDDKHNLLCQVMGEKLIILASPDDASNLYAYEGLLNNTSQVDPENLNLDEFPLCEKVKFYKLILKAGEILFLPKLWFHHVRSLTPSISVSFWFDVEDK